MKKFPFLLLLIGSWAWAVSPNDSGPPLFNLGNVAGSQINPATSDIQTNGTHKTQVTDGTTSAAVKSANTAPASTDPALVVTQSPNSPLSYFHPVYTTRVQTVAVATSAISTTLVANIKATQAGDLIVVNASRKTSTLTITDSASQTYTAAQHITDGTDNNYLFYKDNTAAGVTSVTITAGTTDSLVLIVTEYSGISASGLDKTAGQTNPAVTSWTSGATAATTQASELLIGSAQAILHAADTFVAGTDWTSVNSIANPTGGVNMVAFMEEQYVATTGTYAATGTNSQSDNIIASIGTFFIGTLPTGFTIPGSPTIIKSGAGTLQNITINSPGSGSATATFYDGTSTSGTVLAVVSLTNGIGSLNYGLHYSTGLTMVVSSITGDFTVVYY